MAKRPVNKAKVKLWTERVTMEFEGTIGAAAVESFGAIESREDREYILGMIKERHAAICAREDERAAEQEAQQ
jgi:hypothetical protein